MINTRTVLALLTVAFIAPSQLRAETMVSPDDYDVPVSTAQQLRLGGTYSYSGSGSNTGTSDGSASLVYQRYYNSLPYAWDLNFNGVGLTRRTADGTQEGSYSFVAGPGIRKYFNPEGDFFTPANFVPLAIATLIARLSMSHRVWGTDASSALHHSPRLCVLRSSC